MPDLRKELEARTRDAQCDPRTTQEFIAIALTELDDKLAWDAVVALHYRGTREVFDAACQLCVSACPDERTLGANILGQLGIPTRTYPAESARFLVACLEGESDEDVLEAICIAMGHLHEPATIPWLAGLRSHPSDDLRYAVVFGLLGFECDLAIKTLIELSKDRSTAVRDWATFGLGTQIDENTPEIREALFARVFDEDEETRGEALVGLARRRDERILEPLINELKRYAELECGEYSIAAAKEIAHPRLVPTLMMLKQSVAPHNSTFDEALALCSQTDLHHE